MDAIAIGSMVALLMGIVGILADICLTRARRARRLAHLRRVLS